MSAKISTIRMHNDIKKDFGKLSNVKEFGVAKFSNDYILNKIADKYYKSAKTIENIVFNRTAIAQTAQLTLFTDL